jgi:L-alanine-DL-glutamate epimerase-like enolase superfamily enzyme
VANGRVAAPDGPGLGTRLRPDFIERPDVNVRAAAG